jgi:arsenite methyltransferase
MARTSRWSRLASVVKGRVIPHRFVAAQLSRPSGSFGRWVMTRALNAGNAELIEGTLDALELRSDESLLDVGFGGGRALRLASERTRGSLWGIDLSPDIVTAAHAQLRELVAGGRLNLLTGDVTDLPLRDALVDAICTTNTIYFWPDPARAVTELGRVLSPAGRLAIGFSGPNKLRDYDAITRHGFRVLAPAEVESLLESANFQGVRAIPQTGKTSAGDFVVVGTKPDRGLSR